jgi:hypothetical protein
VAVFGVYPAYAAQPLDEVVECLVAYDPAKMAAWVEWDGPGLIYKEIQSTVEHSGCRQASKWEYWNFRGALAEVLLKRKFGSEAPLAWDSLAPVTDVQMALAWGNNDGRVSMLLNVFSECEARKSPQAVFDLFRTAIGGKEEIAAIKTLKNNGHDCRAIAGGVDVAIADQSLRARLAIALYFMNKQAEQADMKVSD